jgi:NAD/NADP transhydrogenase alpha subunit
MLTKLYSVIQKTVDDFDQVAILIVHVLVLFRVMDWTWAFASTALSRGADLMGTAAVIAAVAAVPQALLTLATNKYVELKYGNTGKTSN